MVLLLELLEERQKPAQDWPALSGPQLASYLPGFLKENCTTPAYLWPGQVPHIRGVRLAHQVIIISKPLPSQDTLNDKYIPP